VRSTPTLLGEKPLPLTNIFAAWRMVFNIYPAGDFPGDLPLHERADLLAEALIFGTVFKIHSIKSRLQQKNFDNQSIRMAIGVFIKVHPFPTKNMQQLSSSHIGMMLIQYLGPITAGMR
jgi:hypothetical protein